MKQGSRAKSRPPVIRTAKQGKEDIPRSTRPTVFSLGDVKEIVSALTRLSGTGDRFQNALTALKQVVHCDAATLYACDDGDESLREVGSVGGVVTSFEFIELSTGRGLSAWTALSRKSVYLAERSKSRHFNSESSYASILSLPLLTADNELVGVLNVGSRATHAFDPDVVANLELICVHLALSLRYETHARELVQVREQVEELDKVIAGQRAQMQLLELLAGSREQRKLLFNQINNALEVIVGSIEALLYKGAAVDQKFISQLRRSEAAAMKIRDAITQLTLVIDPVETAKPRR